MRRIIPLLMLALVGCAGTTSQSQRVATATFENKVLADTENRVMDAISAGVLDRSVHDDLDPYVKSARLAADQLTSLAKNASTTETTFQMVLDQFFAALGPIAAANGQAAAARHPPTTRPAVRLSALRAPPPTSAGHVPPSVLNGDASRFNAPPGR